MRRVLSLAGIALSGFLLSSAAAAASDFRFVCNECDSSDSGTATGDGSTSVGTSNGTALFENGAVPTFASLGLKHPKDLRFTVTIGTPGQAPPTCNVSTLEQQNGFTSCDFNYTAINVTQLNFFVTTTSPYCQQVPSPCATIASVRLGEHFADDVLQTVIFSAPLVSNGGIQLDFGDSTTLQLANKQWQDLFAQMKKVQSYDPDAEFIVGFAVAASAVDPNPNDHNATRIVPFSQIFTINTYSRK